jgi:hypothetical protein
MKTLEEALSLPWKVPVPSTSFVSGPNFEQRPRRVCVLSWEYEGNSEFAKAPREGTIHQDLIFSGVAAFKCTYGLLCGADTINRAYDALVDLGETEWLRALRARVEGPQKQKGEISLHHLAIFFDDGPCYEFICEAVQTSTKVTADN